MRAKLEFNLPEEQIEFDEAINGSKWKYVCWEMNQWLRSNTKYAPDGTSEGTLKAFYDSRDKLLDLINESNLSLD
jgi:hypothetical protein